MNLPISVFFQIPFHHSKTNILTNHFLLLLGTKVGNTIHWISSLVVNLKTVSNYLDYNILCNKFDGSLSKFLHQNWLSSIYTHTLISLI